MPEVKRDHYGRPMIPDPETGKVRPWTRVTTIAGTISDRYNLERWSRRNLIKGFAKRNDLLIRAAAAGDDKKTLDEIADVAMEAGGASEAASIGTALHRILERLDLGEDVDVPDGFRADIDAYRAAMAQASLTVKPGWVERFVVIPELGAAGTPDRLLEPSDVALPVIGDLKTGKDQIKFAFMEIAVQLAIYSRATHWWDGEQFHPMPPVDQNVAVVAHMPAREGRCDLYGVDLRRGWQIAQLCCEARSWRNAKNLLTPMAEVVTLTEQDIALRERVREIVVALEGAPLPHPWPTGVNPPKRQEGPYSDLELSLISNWCDRVAPLTTAAAH